MTRGEHGHPEREGYGATHLGGGLEAQMDEAPSHDPGEVVEEPPEEPASPAT